MKKFLCSGLLIIVLTLTGCQLNQLISMVGNDETDQLIIKSSYYVDCINSNSDRVVESFERYLSWVNPETGPTGKEDYIYGLYDLNDVDKCLDGVAKAKDIGRNIESLETVADGYATALSEVNDIIVDAYDYYEQENYLDDSFDKGKEMHPKIMNAFRNFIVANDKFRAEVSLVEDEINKIELEKYIDSNQPAYLSKKFIIESKKVVDIGNVADFHDINIDEFVKAVEDMEVIMGEIDEYVEANKEEISRIRSYESFVDSAKDYLTTVKKLMRRVRDNKAYSSGDEGYIGTTREWMVEGSPGAILRAYNMLIRTSNNLAF